MYRVREVQQSALSRFQGMSAVLTLTQLLGTIILFYSPHFIVIVSTTALVIVLKYYSDGSEGGRAKRPS